MTSTATQQLGAEYGTALDQDAFRAAMARFPTGVALVTHGSPDDLEAMTVNSFISVSLEPLLVLVSIRADCRIRGRMDGQRAYAIQVLAAGQRHLAELFARRGRPRGARAAARLQAVASPLGNALVPGVVAGFECLPYACHPAGDHVLYLGRVVFIRVAAGDQSALLFHRGAYGHA